jgi:hypothetical protein
MTPKKAPLIGSFLFIDRPRRFNLRPAKSTSRDKTNHFTDWNDGYNPMLQ